jgi:hypothetical protein
MPTWSQDTPSLESGVAWGILLSVLSKPGVDDFIDEGGRPHHSDLRIQGMLGVQSARIDADEFVGWAGAILRMTLPELTCVAQVLRITGEPDIPGRDAVSTRKQFSRWGTRSGSDAMLPLFHTGSPSLPTPKGYPNTKTSKPILTRRSGEPIWLIE